MWSLIHQLNTVTIGRVLYSKYMGRNLGSALSLSLGACICTQDMHVHINNHVFELHGWKSSVELNI